MLLRRIQEQPSTDLVVSTVLKAMDKTEKDRTNPEKNLKIKKVPKGTILRRKK